MGLLVCITLLGFQNVVVYPGRHDVCGAAELTSPQVGREAEQQQPESVDDWDLQKGADAADARAPAHWVSIP